MSTTDQQLNKLSSQMESLLSKRDSEHAILKNDIEYVKLEQVKIREELHGIRVILDDKYVTQKEFSPVRNLVYGLVGTMLMGVIGSVMALVLK